jgi:hypothetical protein
MLLFRFVRRVARGLGRMSANNKDWNTKNANGLRRDLKKRCPLNIFWCARFAEPWAKEKSQLL